MQRSYQSNNGSLMEALAWLLLIGLLILLTAIAWINIQPYKILADQLVGTISLPSDIIGKIPLIGGFASSIKSALFWAAIIGALVLAHNQGGWRPVSMICIFALVTAMGGIQFGIGTFLWAVVQTLECLWIVILFDELALKGALKESKKIESEVGAISSYKDYRDRSIAKRLKGIPYFFVRWAVLLALGAYTFDAIVGWSIYPPAASVDKFISAISIGRWSTINRPMLVKLLIMLFAFEVVLILILVVWQWICSHRRGAAAKPA